MSQRKEVITITPEWNKPDIAATLWKCYDEYRRVFDGYGSENWAYLNEVFFEEWFSLYDFEDPMIFQAPGFILSLHGPSKDYYPFIPKKKPQLLIWKQRPPLVDFNPIAAIRFGNSFLYDLISKHISLAKSLAYRQKLDYFPGDQRIFLSDAEYAWFVDSKADYPQNVLI